MTDSAFNTPQYRKVMAICKVRDRFPTQAWIPDDSEEFIAEVLKTELGDSLEKLEDGVAVGVVDFTEDSEYKRLYESKSDQKIMETKGRDTCSTKTSRQNSERNRC